MRARVVIVVLMLLVPLAGTVIPAASAREVWTPPRQLSASGSDAVVATNDSGDSVAVWARDDALVFGAFRPDGGAWSRPVRISDGAYTVYPPSVVLDAAGRATVTWTEYTGGPLGYSGDFNDLMTAQGRAGRPWSAPAVLARQVGPTPAPVAVSPSGTVTVTWERFSGCVDVIGLPPCTPEEIAAGRYHVRVASRTARGTWGAVTDLGEGDHPALVGGGGGRLVAVWLTRPARGSVAGAVTTSTRSPAGVWGSRVTPASGDGWAASPEVVVDAAGSVTAGWTVCDGPASTQDCHQQSASRAASGAWGAVSTLPEQIPGEAGRSAVDLAVDGSGRVTALWWEGSLVASTRTANGWGPIQDVIENGGGIGSFDLAADRAGRLVATWVRTSSDSSTSTVRAAYRPLAGDWQPTEVLDRAATPDSGDSAHVAATGSRFTVIHDARGVVVTERVDDRTAPVARMRGSYARAVGSPRTRVGWIVRDTEAGVARVQVRRRTAGYRGSFGGWSSWRDTTTARSATLSGLPGRTYCFSARAVDRAGNRSAWSRGKCVSTPVDDRSLRAGAGWRRVRTETRTTRRGAELRLPGVRGRRLYVVATRCPRCGTVQVQLGARRAVRVSLRSATVRPRRLVPAGAFSRTRQGDLRIRVVSEGRSVRVDGVVAAR